MKRNVNVGALARWQNNKTPEKSQVFPDCRGKIQKLPKLFFIEKRNDGLLPVFKRRTKTFFRDQRIGSVTQESALARSTSVGVRGRSPREKFRIINALCSDFTLSEAQEW